MKREIAVTLHDGLRAQIVFDTIVFRALPGEQPGKTRIYIPFIDAFDVRETFEEVRALIQAAKKLA